MNHSRARRAFTIVELLVALILAGAAAAGLTSGVMGDRRLRELAAANSFAADRARERLEWLAAAPCAPEASGGSASAVGAETWHASADAFEWHLTDSLLLRRSSAPVIIEARVACPE
jgi:prepilin-type N-terminal cleavage/methylation domain-containing protein